MAEQQSEVHPYKSRYAANLWLTPTQFLAESMVARQIRRQGGDPPLRFWQLDRYKRAYAVQARHAAGLLKLYSVNAVVAALRTRDGSKIYSFSAKWLDPLVKFEQEKIDRQKLIAEAAPPAEQAEATGETQARPAFVQPTTMSKLRDL